MGIVSGFFDRAAEREAESGRHLRELLRETKESPFSGYQYGPPKKGKGIRRGGVPSKEYIKKLPFDQQFFIDLDAAGGDEGLEEVVKDHFIHRMMSDGKDEDVASKAVNKMYQEWLSGGEGSKGEIEKEDEGLVIPGGGI